MITDKRIIKTRTNIKTALMKILQNKELNKVTVSDIAETALINRSTFYLHYTDATAVVNDIEREISEKVKTVIEKLNFKQTYASVFSVLNTLTSMLDNADIFKSYILHSTNSSQILHKIKNVFAEKVYEFYSQMAPHRNSPILFYKVNFVTSGIVDSYLAWVYAKEKSVSLEELCKMLSETVDLIIPKTIS